MQIQVCFITGVTYLGIPLNGSVLQQVSNAAACQSICVSTPSCTHFTWFFLGGKCRLFTFPNVIGGVSITSSCFHLLQVGRWAGAWAGGQVGRRVGVHAHMCGWAQARAGRKAGMLHACMCLFEPFSNTFRTFFEPLYM